MSWLIISAGLFVTAFIIYQNNNSFLGYSMFAFAIFTLMFYPLYQRQHYKNHYTRFIADNYKNRLGLMANVYFTENAIETHDTTGESKIHLSELESMTETGDYFYLSLKNSGHIIIPKSKISDVSQLRKEIKLLCEKLKINFIEDLNWKWK